MNKPFNSLSRPRLAIPLGDPAGIGSEVVLKALADPQIRRSSEITVIGSRSLLEKTYSQPLAIGRSSGSANC